MKIILVLQKIRIVELPNIWYRPYFHKPQLMTQGATSAAVTSENELRREQGGGVADETLATRRPIVRDTMAATSLAFAQHPCFDHGNRIGVLLACVRGEQPDLTWFTNGDMAGLGTGRRGGHSVWIQGRAGNRTRRIP